MKFLLQGRKLPIRGIRANTPLPVISALSSKTPKDSTKIFGQQCSPQCGCILRFEASLDSNGHVDAATYHAKQILCTQASSSQSSSSAPSTLMPAFTMSRKPKPLFVECSCQSLHRLAKQVVAQLPFHRDLRNQVEFKGVRSSLAFSHAVLRRFHLPTQKTQCMDLVEDALNAMIKQCLPQPLSTSTSTTKRTIRQTSSQFPETFTSWLQRQQEMILEHAEEEEFVERFGRALRRVRKPRHDSMSSSYGQDANPSFTFPSSVASESSSSSASTSYLSSLMPSSSPHSALTLMDWMLHQQELRLISDQEGYNHDGESTSPFSSLSIQNKQKWMDWEAYVDELEHFDKDADEATG